MSDAVQVVLKPGKAAPFLNRHPWVLDSAVGAVRGSPADGEVVDLVSDAGRWIARGIYSGRSRIRVRLYSWTLGKSLDADLWRQRIAAAFSLRESLGYSNPHGACRLVFSEADWLSGLIVDRFCNHLVVQPTALAMATRLTQIIEILLDLAKPTSLVVRTDGGAARREGFTLESGVAYGSPPPDPVIIDEHGLQFAVRLLTGQKTGFYLDQRENRRRAAEFMTGRRLLDVCCYTGGFALAASRSGHAREVVGFDSSQAAIEMARENAARNGIENAIFETGDCFQVLEQKARAGERFDAIVLDPPKFAQSRKTVPEALRAYHRLNRLAVEMLETGGILVSCSCSGSVSREEFRDMLFGVAAKARRRIQVLEQRAAAPDHPLNLACLETDYLKCFICRVI